MIAVSGGAVPRHRLRRSCLRAVAFSGAIASPGMSIAEPWACDFTVECITGEGCGAGDFQAEIIAADHEGRLFYSTATGDTPMARLSPAGAMPAAYASTSQDGLSEFLTIRGDSTATLTTHFFSGVSMAATYFGTCEVMN